MANLAPTILPKLMALYKQELQNKTELRTGIKPFIGMAMQANDILQPQEIINVRESDKRPINANCLIRPNSTSGVARETTHTGPNADSNTDPLVWTTYTEKLSWTLQQFDDNIISAPLTLAIQIQSAIDDLMTRIETAGVAYLESNKSAININDNSLGTWNAGADVFEIASTNVARSPYIATNNMRQNKYMPRYDVIGDSAVMAKYREIFAQGTGNSVNNGWQNFGDFDLMESFELTSGVYSGISYWMPKYSIGMLDWIPAANRRGDGFNADSQNGILGVFFDSRYPGIPFAISIYTTRTDMSASNGSTQSYVRQIEISLDFVFRKAELSTATETVIQAVGQLV